VARVRKWNRPRNFFNNDVWTGSTSTPLKMGQNAPVVGGPTTLLRTIAFVDSTTYVFNTGPGETGNQGYGWWQDTELGVLVWLRQESIETPPDWSDGDTDPRMLMSGLLQPFVTPLNNLEFTTGFAYTVEWRLATGVLQSHGERLIDFPLPGMQVEVSLYNQQSNPEAINWLDPALWHFNQSGRCYTSCLWEGNA